MKTKTNKSFTKQKGLMVLNLTPSRVPANFLRIFHHQVSPVEILKCSPFLTEPLGHQKKAFHSSSAKRVGILISKKSAKFDNQRKLGSCSLVDEKQQQTHNK